MWLTGIGPQEKLQAAKNQIARHQPTARLAKDGKDMGAGKFPCASATAARERKAGRNLDRDAWHTSGKSGN
jgi:hypothetical protein